MYHFKTKLLAAGLTSLMLTSSAFAETKLLFSTFFPPKHPLYSDVFVPWAEDIKAATDGRVVVEFAPSSLAPPPGQLDMIENGVADITAQFTGVAPKRLAAHMITEVPGPAASAENMSVALWKTHLAHLSGTGNMKRSKVLSTFAFPNQAFFNMKDDPIDTMEELSKAKIATTPGNAATGYGKITSGVVAGPAFKYFELVSKGVVDAYAVVTPLEVPAFNLMDYTKSFYTMGDISTAGSFILAMNAKKWKSIPEADQSIIEKLSGEAFARRLAVLDAKVEGVKKMLEGKGITNSPLPEEMAVGMKQAFSFMEVNWIASVKEEGVDGVAALKTYRDALASMSN